MLRNPSARAFSGAPLKTAAIILDHNSQSLICGIDTQPTTSVAAGMFNRCFAALPSPREKHCGARCLELRAVAYIGERPPARAAHSGGAKIVCRKLSHIINQVCQRVIAGIDGQTISSSDLTALSRRARHFLNALKRPCPAWARSPSTARQIAVEVRPQVIVKCLGSSRRTLAFHGPAAALAAPSSDGSRRDDSIFDRAPRCIRSGAARRTHGTKTVS